MKIPESTETLIKYLQCIDILSSEMSKYNFRKNVYTFIAAQRKQLYDELKRRIIFEKDMHND